MDRIHSSFVEAICWGSSITLPKLFYFVINTLLLLFNNYFTYQFPIFFSNVGSALSKLFRIILFLSNHLFRVKFVSKVTVLIVQRCISRVLPIFLPVPHCFTAQHKNVSLYLVSTRLIYVSTRLTYDEGLQWNARPLPVSPHRVNYGFLYPLPVAPVVNHNGGFPFTGKRLVILEGSTKYACQDF